MIHRLRDLNTVLKTTSLLGVTVGWVNGWLQPCFQLLPTMEFSWFDNESVEEGVRLECLSEGAVILMSEVAMSSPPSAALILVTSTSLIDELKILDPDFNLPQS